MTESRRTQQLRVLRLESKSFIDAFFNQFFETPLIL